MISYFLFLSFFFEVVQTFSLSMFPQCFGEGLCHHPSTSRADLAHRAAGRQPLHDCLRMDFPLPQCLPGEVKCTHFPEFSKKFNHMLAFFLPSLSCSATTGGVHILLSCDKKRQGVAKAGWMSVWTEV